MEPFLVLPFSGIRPAGWLGSSPTSSRLLTRYVPTICNTAYIPPVAWVLTITVCHPVLLVAPGDESENQEEEADDVELESDEDHSKLRVAQLRLGAEEGSPAARGDGTINPPFP